MDLAAPDATVLDLAADTSTPDGVALSWLMPDATTDTAFAVAIDGDLAAVLPADARAFAVPLLDAGEHTVAVVPFDGSQAAPRVFAAPFGNRVRLTWSPSASADCVAYRVYTNGGSGAVAYTTPVAVLDTIDVEPAARLSRATGTGTGTIAVGGVWTGPATNRNVTLRITSGGWESDALAAGVFVAGGGDFDAGDQADLGNGIVVQFNSLRSAYATNDTFAIRVGPPRRWMSGRMDSGTDRFGVRAVDAAGNESSSIGEVDVVIVGTARGVESLAITRNAAGLVSLSWSLPTPGADLGSLIDVYANYSPATGRLSDAINLDTPFVTIAATNTGYAFTPSVHGEWRFYVRHRHASAASHRDPRNNQSIEMLRVDSRALPTTVALRAPEGLTVTPIAGGAFRLAWRYPREGGEALTQFRVFANADPNAPAFTSPIATVTASTSDGISPVLSYTLDTDPFVAAAWFTVRASNGTISTPNTDMVQGTPDATAPTFTGSLTGGAT